jgi:hypothetical protein
MRKLWVSLIVFALLVLSFSRGVEAADRTIASTTALTTAAMEIRLAVLADDGTAWGLHLNPSWESYYWDPPQLMSVAAIGVWEQLPALPEGRTFKELRTLDTKAQLDYIPIFAIALATDGTLWQLLPPADQWYCWDYAYVDINLAAWYSLAPPLPPSE